MKNLSLQKTAIAFLILAVSVISGSILLPDNISINSCPAVETTGFLG